MMTDKELIHHVLRICSITDELREWEMDELANGISVHGFRSGEYLCQPGQRNDDDSLIIFASGEARVMLAHNDEITKLKTLKAGDLAGVITFIGGNPMQISATVLAITDCKVLRLNREYFENLIHRQSSIVLCVMQGIIRYLHGILRNQNSESTDITNYIYRTNTIG